MNKVILQLWEESNIENDPLSDGCSLHVNLEERNKYINDIYDLRDIKNIPDFYDRIIGDPIEVFVDDQVYNSIDKSVKLNEASFRNLLKLEEIIFNESTI